MLAEGGYVKRGKPYKIDGKMYYPLASGDQYNVTGIGSWYGEKFHGKQTANGERYDMYAMTAAHPTLPMPSMVRVTNLDNGKSIQVRVNDRGPFVKSRLIDLSYTAAKALDYAEQGTAQVRVETLSSADVQVALPIAELPVAQLIPQAPALVQNIPSVDPIIQQTQPRIQVAYVQVGAFSAKENADSVITALQPNLKENHPPLRVVSADKVFRVRLGPFDLDQDAVFALEHVRNQGYKTAMLVHD